jgi:hypothetical protein
MNPELARLADWRPLIAVLAAYGGIVIALALYGKGEWGFDPRVIARKIANGLERITGIPGWAAAMVGTASFGVLVAGMGFYNDVNWHVSLGRDKALFTAPHTAIVIGLITILGSAFIGEFFASATKANVGWRVFGMRIPYSAIAMGLLGVCALAGFPLDDLWHKTYGIDVTMWSPTHMLMIVGAGLSPLASWLALGEAGVRPDKSKWAGGLHIAVGAFSLLGLSSVAGEFAFGVPQFQQLYHPVLYALAGGFALSAIAVVVKRWWALLIVAGVGLVLGTGDGLVRSSNGGARSAALYIVAAIGVALVVRFLGTELRLRFAVVTGVVIGTVGLAGEWLWSQGGYQRWNASLLPEAPILATVVGIGAALLGVAFASAIRREPIAIPTRALALGAVAVLAGLVIPFPRPGLDASADVHLIRAKDGVKVQATVTPANAAVGAHWFQAMAWQGDGFRVADMKPTGTRGVYESDGVVPVSGKWKALLRLHKGASMVAIPIWLPADPEIGAAEIPAVDRNAEFLTEQRFLLREQHNGAQWFSIAVYVVLAGISLLWVGGFVLAARKVSPRGTTVEAGLAHV